MLKHPTYLKNSRQCKSLQNISILWFIDYVSSICLYKPTTYHIVDVEIWIKVSWLNENTHYTSNKVYTNISVEKLIGPYNLNCFNKKGMHIAKIINLELHFFGNI